MFRRSSWAGVRSRRAVCSDWGGSPISRSALWDDRCRPGEDGQEQHREHARGLSAFFVPDSTRARSGAPARGPLVLRVVHWTCLGAVLVLLKRLRSLWPNSDGTWGPARSAWNADPRKPLTSEPVMYRSRAPVLFAIWASCVDTMPWALPAGHLVTVGDQHAIGKAVVRLLDLPGRRRTYAVGPVDGLDSEDVNDSGCPEFGHHAIQVLSMRLFQYRRPANHPSSMAVLPVSRFFWHMDRCEAPSHSTADRISVGCARSLKAADRDGLLVITTSISQPQRGVGAPYCMVMPVSHVPSMSTAFHCNRLGRFHSPSPGWRSGSCVWMPKP